MSDWLILCCGLVLCIVGCLAASGLYLLNASNTPSSSCDKNVSIATRWLSLVGVSRLPIAMVSLVAEHGF